LFDTPVGFLFTVQHVENGTNLFRSASNVLWIKDISHLLCGSWKEYVVQPMKIITFVLHLTIFIEISSMKTFWRPLYDCRPNHRCRSNIFFYSQFRQHFDKSFTSLLSKETTVDVTFDFDQGRWNSDRTRGSVKEMRRMETYEINHYQLCLFLFRNNVDLKKITEIV